MEDVTSLLIKTLHDKLPDMPVYREKIPTAFSEPSFSLNRISLSSKGEPNGRDMRLYSFDIAYFPEPNRPREDMDTMAEWLTANLTSIEPNYAALINRDIAVVDDILHYTFDVRARVRVGHGELFNQPIDYKGGLKNGQ
ncbi:DUF6838 family protein [uncultured Leuconostoc sp.]|uniref:phage tail terminator family protein n=1 Tax=uncultured Leuconostoc sp. TaxID=173262 RepID=UPI0025DDC9BC|nr:hypothetical protein [uncultured Leuconostoc sp.]